MLDMLDGSIEVVESNQFQVDKIINEVESVVPLNVPVAAG